MALRDEEILSRLEGIITHSTDNVNQLSEQLVVVVGTMSNFVTQLKDRPTKRQFYVLAVIALLILVGLGIQTRQNGDTGARIESCTTPGGECAKESARTTQVALLQIKCEQINEINQLAERNHLQGIDVPELCKNFNAANGTGG